MRLKCFFRSRAVCGGIFVSVIRRTKKRKIEILTSCELHAETADVLLYRMRYMTEQGMVLTARFGIGTEEAGRVLDVAEMMES